MAYALADRDVQGILGFLYNAGEADGHAVLTDAAVAALVDLMQADSGGVCNVWSGLDPKADLARISVNDFENVDSEWFFGLPSPWTNDDTEIVRRLVERDEPIPPHPQFMRTPLRTSDLHSQRALQANEMLRELSPRHWRDTLWVWLPGPEKGTLRRISFNSARYGGIGDREVRILELLTPHFTQLIKRAATRRNVSPGRHGLTPREFEVLSLVGAGKTNKEIAHELWLSPHKVRTHLENAFEKLEVTNRTAAVARAFGDPAAAGRLH
jgi:DNA-binding CsgD family transcriptional regulator